MTLLAAWHPVCYVIVVSAKSFAASVVTLKHRTGLRIGISCSSRGFSGRRSVDDRDCSGAHYSTHYVVGCRQCTASNSRRRRRRGPWAPGCLAGLRSTRPQVRLKDERWSDKAIGKLVSARIRRRRYADEWTDVRSETIDHTSGRSRRRHYRSTGSRSPTPL